MRRRGLAGAVAGLMIFAAVAPAWGNEVAAPYPQLFPWQTEAVGAPATATDPAALPPRQPVKAAATGKAATRQRQPSMASGASTFASRFPLRTVAPIFLVLMGVAAFIIYAIPPDSSSSKSGGGGGSSSVSSTTGT